MSSLKEVYDTSMAGFQAALGDEEHAFRRASLTGDLEEQVRSSQSMASIRAAIKEYQSMAEEAAQKVQPNVSNGYGLSAREREVAHASITDENIPNAEKERLYALGKQRMQHMKANGTWNDR